MIKGRTTKSTLRVVKARAQKELTAEHSILSNNLRALAIHGAIVGVSLVAVIFLQNFFYFAVFAFGMIAPLLLYVLLAFRFLVPLSKGNFLSVLFLPILLIAFFLATMAQINAMLALNFPSSFAILAIYASLIEEPTLSYELSALAPALISALMPSLLMYAGLCLKAWQQNRNCHDDFSELQESIQAEKVCSNE